MALAVASTVALVLPLGYAFEEYADSVHRTDRQAAVKAGAVTSLIAGNPGLWAYQVQRMEELLLRHPVPMTAGDSVKVYDAQGQQLVSLGGAPASPVLDRFSLLYDSGRVVGRVEIRHSLRGFIYECALVTLLGLLLGGLVYGVMLTWPMRALQRMNAALEAERLVRREREERFQMLFDRAGEGILVLTPEGKIVAANESFARMHGYTKHELASLCLEDLDTPEAFALAPDRMRHLLSGEFTTFEVEHRHKDGHVFPLEVSVSLISLDGNSLIQSFYRDITERQRSEQALRESEVQFRSLVEQSIVGIYIVQDGKFVYVNPRFAEIRGYVSTDEILGRDVLPLIVERDRSSVAENNRRLLAGEVRSIPYNFAALCKDGSVVEIGAHASGATYKGRPAVIGLVQDITDKKRAEREIQLYIDRLSAAFMSAVSVARNMSELRDPYTAGHERRVGEIAAAIGTELGLEERRVEGLRVAGFLHDVGKITIPAEILSKPGKLSAIEHHLIQVHPQAGYDVLKGVEFPWPVAEVALQHHERMDGKGYPQGIKGDMICLEARIIAVSDVVEAMASHRPYRPGLGLDKALAEIESGSGSSFDPVVVGACLKLFREKAYLIPA
jgi:PAS domain S-box-containing protein